MPSLFRSDVVTVMDFPTVQDFREYLRAYFPPEFSLQRALHTIGTVIQLGPLLEFITNQSRLPRQPHETAWHHDVEHAIRLAREPEEMYENRKFDGEPIGEDQWDWEPLYRDFESKYTSSYIKKRKFIFISLVIKDTLDIFNWQPGLIPTKFRISPPVLLVTRHRHCLFCPEKIPLYHSKPGLFHVSLIDRDMEIKKAYITVAKCNKCLAAYHPDRVSVVGPKPRRRDQLLDCDTQYLLISPKKNLWVHRSVAHMQANATHRFRASWLGFADFFSRSFLPPGSSELRPELWEDDCFKSME